MALCLDQKYHSLMFSEQKSKSSRGFEACNPALLELLTTCLRGSFHKTLSRIFFQKELKKKCCCGVFPTEMTKVRNSYS